MAEVVLISGPHLILDVTARWGGWVFGLVSFPVPPSRGAVRLFGACVYQACGLYGLVVELRQESSLGITFGWLFVAIPFFGS
jgi:hypothetical protein